ncbi:DNA-binding transcriptional LysR family regulator [Actinomadura hallensis]|uniref:DNA-binding transcriptional LysR family regulator n=1 Tax=Actinomadura hallensis TaxID=337895 RepID=A0A543IE91_9ACTN|nr:LysR substrate-binding domain-containing protein [Actinomadura hallensis]TQM68902.1 DNA-binding transcriptional LysR family regulator [Actinomadura hallensis]HLV75458.1 LysR substrate-binding domain-containing protein [Vulgatibacteraceae bacterium]
MRPLDLLNGRLKLRHLVLVVAIADQGSVLRAAEHLHLAQPAVTRSLREVEGVLGVELFTRGPRGVTPTLFGDAFVEHARAVLAELRRAGERIAGLADGEVGTVTIGTLLAGSNVLLPRAIAALKRDRPGIRVIVQEATFDAQVPRLLDGEIDLILGRLNPIDDLRGLRQITLYGEPVRLVARRDHPARSRPGLRLADLLGYPWVLPLEQTALRTELEQVFRAEGLALPGDLVECTSVLTVRTLVRDTDMIAALPELVARTDAGIAPLPVPLETVRRQVGVTLPAHRAPTPSARIMLDHLRREAAELTA